MTTHVFIPPLPARASPCPLLVGGDSGREGIEVFATARPLFRSDHQQSHGRLEQSPTWKWKVCTTQRVLPNLRQAKRLLLSDLKKLAPDLDDIAPHGEPAPDRASRRVVSTFDLGLEASARVLIDFGTRNWCLPRIGTELVDEALGRRRPVSDVKSYLETA